MTIEQSNSQVADLKQYPFAKRCVLNALRQIEHGMLIIDDQSTTENTQFVFGKSTSIMARTVHLKIRDQRFYDQLFIKGDLGAGEAYLLGYWSCDDLTLLVQLFIKNRETLSKLEAGKSWLVKPLQKLYAFSKRNTLQGSKENIHAHYDLGNDLFEQFLDESMMYSSAIFNHADESLHSASLNKLERLCQKLDLQASDHVVEIGTGWGGFALYAAEHYGCRVTTTTISDEQHDYAQARVNEAGLQNKITILKKDYRELTGQFDKLVSIEMIEAIGHQYLDTYFAQCSRLLKPNGVMCLQAITIADQRYDHAKNNVDFIQRFIFPGGFLPSVSAMSDSVARKTDMRLYDLEDIGQHYAHTLKHWRTRFFDRISDIRQLGYDEKFVRMWEYYLCYCEGGFREQVIGAVQMLLIKPAALQTIFK